jgi:hypothetical protein
VQVASSVCCAFILESNLCFDGCHGAQILGNGMSNKMWEGTVEHAKTCVLSGKLHVYYADEKQNIGVIFNNIFQLMGLIADGSYMSVDSLSDSEKVLSLKHSW